MWTSVNMHEQWSRNANGEVTDFRLVALRIGAGAAQVANIAGWKGSWFTDNGGSPAYKWITEIAPATYFNPPIYGTIWEQRMTELWMTDRGTLFDDAIPSSERQQGPYQYLIDFYASKDVNFPPPWDPQKQYHGPRSDGLVDIVTDTDSGGRLFACVALRDSVGVKPSSSWQSGYGGGGQEDPNNYWWRAQGGGRGGNLAQAYENCGYLANNPMFGLIPGTNTTGIGVMAYEGGWSPDTDSTAEINNFRYETQRANTLRYCAYRNYELFHQGSVKHGVIEHKAGWNPSEFSFGGGSIWSVWFTRGPGNFFAHMDPPLPPRWLAMLDWNAQRPPPPPPKEVRHPVVSPRHLVVSPKSKQASPRTPAKVPQSVPSWCRGLTHPNLSVCGPGDEGQ
jgi:hypothetical protein